MKQRDRRNTARPGRRPTLRAAGIVTAVSLLFLVLDALLTFWSDGPWPMVGGVFGIVGIAGLAQALAIALFARRG